LNERINSPLASQAFSGLNETRKIFLHKALKTSTYEEGSSIGVLCDCTRTNILLNKKQRSLFSTADNRILGEALSTST
jgi:hypothetical protein